MNSIPYPENTTKKNVHEKLAKAVTLLIISLGLLWFSIGVPAFLLFEPQSIGWLLWLSYANDLILPFSLYFFTCLAESWLQTWRARALLAFAIPTLLEFGQLFYYRVSTSHYVGSFDPFDILMYAISVGLAVITERNVFARLFKFWQ